MFIRDIEQSLLGVCEHSGKIKSLKTHFLDLSEQFRILITVLSDGLDLLKHNSLINIGRLLSDQYRPPFLKEGTARSERVKVEIPC